MKNIVAITISGVIFILSFCCIASDKHHEIEFSICQGTLDNFASTGISINIEDINKRDQNGLREGLWVEDNGYIIILTHYVNGQKNGIERIFIRYQNIYKLSYIVSFINNIMRSIILFDEKTGLTSVFVDNIKPNDESINYPVDWIPGNSFPYIGYSRYYNPSNGQIEAEGYEVFGQDWEQICERIGQWIIYSKDGTVSVHDYGGYGGCYDSSN